MRSLNAQKASEQVLQSEYLCFRIAEKGGVSVVKEQIPTSASVHAM